MRKTIREDVIVIDISDIIIRKHIVPYITYNGTDMDNNFITDYLNNLDL